MPEISALRQTTNTDGLRSLLTGWSGIADNVREPPRGQTRLPLSANARHALRLCFQPQDEIIRKDQLFHDASDTQNKHAAQDTLPYFLGAVDADFIRKREELRRLRRELRSQERRLKEILALRGEGASRAMSLLAQARDAGLTRAQADSWEDAVGVLRAVAATPPTVGGGALTEVPEYSRLSNERARLLDEQRKLRDEIGAVRAFEADERGFSREAEAQQGRLRTIGIFIGSEQGETCPLCERELESSSIVPTIEQLEQSLSLVSSKLDAVVRTSPHVERAMLEVENRLERARQNLIRNRDQMEAVRQENERLAHTQDEFTRAVHVLGRISLYLESLPEAVDAAEMEDSINALTTQCDKLEYELSAERTHERLTSIISLLSQSMTRMARALGLEHAEHPLRLEVRNLTIVADTPNGPLPMSEMGSGANWVGYHLVGHLALHEWFVNRDRPVPRFLFLDQPSQVYFPAEVDDAAGSLESLAETDREAVRRMFKLIFDVVDALSPHFQVILTEHADLREDWYQRAVVERWRGAVKLIPEDWPRRS